MTGASGAEGAVASGAEGAVASGAEGAVASVDRVLEALTGLPDVPLEEHPAALDRAHRALEQLLAGMDGRDDPA